MTIALAGAAALHTGVQYPAVAALSCTFLSAVCCVCALWPRKWVLNGYDPDSILSQTLHTELEVLESLAAGLAAGRQHNKVGSQIVAIYLRLAWILFCCAPVAGLFVVLLRNPH